MKRMLGLILLMALLDIEPLCAQDTIDLHAGETYVLGGPRMHRSDAMDTLQKWDFHLSMGSGVTMGHRTSASLFGITPSLVYRPNERLKICASASLLNSYSLMPAGFHLRGQEARSMAPLRNPRAGAVAGTVHLSASYRVNERLWVAGSLTHVAGQLASGALINPWLMYRGPVELDATAMTAAMRYRFKNDTFLDIHMTFIDDRTGALGPLLFGGPYGSYDYYHTTAFGGHLF